MERNSRVYNVCFDEQVYATVIKNDYSAEGVHFFTEANYSQQIAYMHHPKEKTIDAHTHNCERRDVFYTQEVLVIRKGILRVDFYIDADNYCGSIVLEQGDIILLVSGGHGFKVLEEVEMIEVKQGPYLGERDKTRFQGIRDDEVKWVNE